MDMLDIMAKNTPMAIMDMVMERDLQNLVIMLLVMTTEFKDFMVIMDMVIMVLVVMDMGRGLLMKLNMTDTMMVAITLDTIV